MNRALAPPTLPGRARRMSLAPQAQEAASAFDGVCSNAQRSCLADLMSLVDNTENADVVILAGEEEERISAHSVLLCLRGGKLGYYIEKAREAAPSVASSDAEEEGTSATEKEEESDEGHVEEESSADEIELEVEPMGPQGEWAAVVDGDELGTVTLVGLPQVPFDVAQVLLQWIYSGTALGPLLEIAEALSLPNLTRLVTGWMWAHMDVELACILLPRSRTLGDKSMRSLLLQYVDHHALEMFQEDGLYLLAEEDVSAVLVRDSLLCVESEVFRGVVRWGKAKYPDASDKELGEHVGELFQLVRFALMGASELHRTVQRIGIPVDRDLLVEAFRYLSLPESERVALRTDRTRPRKSVRRRSVVSSRKNSSSSEEKVEAPVLVIEPPARGQQRQRSSQLHAGPSLILEVSEEDHEEEVEVDMEEEEMEEPKEPKQPEDWVWNGKEWVVREEPSESRYEPRTEPIRPSHEPRSRYEQSGYEPRSRYEQSGYEPRSRYEQSGYEPRYEPPERPVSRNEQPPQQEYISEPQRQRSFAREFLTERMHPMSPPQWRPRPSAPPKEPLSTSHLRTNSYGRRGRRSSLSSNFGHTSAIPMSWNRQAMSSAFSVAPSGRTLCLVTGGGWNTARLSKHVYPSTLQFWNVEIQVDSDMVRLMFGFVAKNRCSSRRDFLQPISSTLREGVCASSSALVLYGTYKTKDCIRIETVGGDGGVWAIFYVNDSIVGRNALPQQPPMVLAVSCCSSRSQVSLMGVLEE